MDVIVDDWSTRRARDGDDARRDAILGAVRVAGGIIRSSALRSRGFSTHAISAAVGAGCLERVRRVWVCLPDVEPALRAAAAGGVVLTCATEARRRQIWAVEPDQIHAAASPHAGRVPFDGCLHWAAPVVPRDPASLTDPIENVLVIAASCQPHELALAMWESAARQNLVDMAVMKRLALTGRARALVDEVQPVADSGLETIFRVRFAWLRLPIRGQVWILRKPVDILIGDRLVVQIDGGHHVGRQRTADIEHDALLKLHGYHVIRVGYEQVMHRWPEVHDVVVRAIAQGLHRA